MCRSIELTGSMTTLAAALNFSQQVAAFEAGASNYLSLGVFLV